MDNYDIKSNVNKHFYASIAEKYTGDTLNSFSENDEMDTNSFFGGLDRNFKW